jgi:hypothetical protein
MVYQSWVSTKAPPIRPIIARTWLGKLRVWALNPVVSVSSKNLFPFPKSYSPGLGFRIIVEMRYRGTSLTRKRNPLGPYRRPMPRAPWLS